MPSATSSSWPREVRHLVLTRSAYGPDWTPAAIERRLRVTAGVTARLMAAQTTRDWTWVVLVDPRDPFLAKRLEILRAAAPRLVPIEWIPGNVAPAPWDPHGDRANRIQQIAATAYRAPWAQAVGPRDELVLQTRLDDDDGLAIDALERVQAAARTVTARTALMHPFGVRVWAGRYSRVRHDTNAMHTLATLAGDELGVYDYGHRKVAAAAPVRIVDNDVAWLWARHVDTISGHRQADHPISTAVRRLFPIDWSVLA